MSNYYTPFAELVSLAKSLFSPISIRLRRGKGARAKTKPAKADGQFFLNLGDGAKIGYQIAGSKHLKTGATPIVIVLGMSAIISDIEEVTAALMKSHTVLVYDHRGIGSSTLSEAGDEDLSIELMARDLLALVAHVGWKKVALVGWSMGGVISQQLLTLPFLETNPTPLPAAVSHVVLVGTRSKVHANTGLNLGPTPEKPVSLEERKVMTRRIVLALLDPTFIEQYPEKVKQLEERSIRSLHIRPPMILAKQGVAVRNFKFDHLLDKISRDTQILVVHGKADRIIPFHCGEEILTCIPWAKAVEVGDKPGQVPSLTFGHYWHEYFGTKVWNDVIHTFVSPKPSS